MTAQMMALIITWCSGVHTNGPAVVNGPDAFMTCRQKLVKCVDDNASYAARNEIPNECLKDSLDVR